MSTSKTKPSTGSRSLISSSPQTTTSASASSYNSNSSLSSSQHHKNQKNGPAEWRKHKGKVRGLARRKGESSPFRWGFDVDDSVLGHPAWASSTDLPLLKKKRKRGKNTGGGGGGLLGKLGGLFGGKKK